MSKSAEQIIYRTAAVTLGINLLLTACKLLAGIFGHSDAMVADAIHSASDAFTTVLVIIGARIASRQADASHPYGHERMECVLSLALALCLLGVGVGIGWNGVKALFFPPEQEAAPTALALAAAVLSILVKEGMYRYTVHAAKQTGSLSLKADAWHHRSDALSSIGSLFGIGGAMLGFARADALAASVLALVICKVAFDLCRDTLGRLIDRAAPPETQEQIRAAARNVSGVLSVDRLRTRLFGSRVEADLEIGADGSLSLWQAHDIAERVENAVKQDVPGVKSCTVHVNPIRGIFPQ